MLNVSNVQHFSLGDGEGIRTTVFLKGCNLHCPWCHNPETLSPRPVQIVYPKTTVKYGATVTAQDVLTEVLEDKDFYEESGGGVTVSGGEPMLQAKDLKELLVLFKRNDLRVIIDTAGSVDYGAFEEINGLVDEYFFDLKGFDQDKYSVVGGNFSTVTSNLKRLIAEGNRVRVRIPLIPNFNADAASAEKLCAVLKQCGATRVDLLPFHRLAVGKYKGLGLEYPYKSVPLLTSEQIAEIAKVFEKDFKIKIEK